MQRKAIGVATKRESDAIRPSEIDCHERINQRFARAKPIDSRRMDVARACKRRARGLIGQKERQKATKNRDALIFARWS